VNHSRRCLYSLAQPTRTSELPAFVRIDQLVDGVVEITVRGPPDGVVRNGRKRGADPACWYGALDPAMLCGKCLRARRARTDYFLSGGSLPSRSSLGRLREPQKIRLTAEQWKDALEDLFSRA
jgi:hypothetical protein